MKTNTTEKRKIKNKKTDNSKHFNKITDLNTSSFVPLNSVTLRLFNIRVFSFSVIKKKKKEEDVSIDHIA